MADLCIFIRVYNVKYTCSTSAAMKPAPVGNITPKYCIDTFYTDVNSGAPSFEFIAMQYWNFPENPVASDSNYQTSCRWCCSFGYTCLSTFVK